MTEQILAVQRMQDYIEENLDERVTMVELSCAAGFSPWYSYRLFQRFTGLTPPCYARRLRLACFPANMPEIPFQLRSSCRMVRNFVNLERSSLE